MCQARMCHGSPLSSTAGAPGRPESVEKAGRVMWDGGREDKLETTRRHVFTPTFIASDLPFSPFAPQLVAKFLRLVIAVHKE